MTTGTEEPTVVTVTSDRSGKLYTRVFESILDSSINVQSVPPSARWLWITMLLIADHDRTGVVDIPNERLAAKAGLTLDQTLEGLAILSAPDAESRTEEEEGRRIVPIRDGSTRGWRLVNWERYRQIATEEQRREETRQRVARHRSKRGDVTGGNKSDVACNASEATADAKERKEENLFGEIGEERFSFDEVWNSYRRKRGRAAAERHFKAQIKTLSDFAAIRAAVANYNEELDILGTDEAHTMHGSTFFNDRWRDFVPGVWTPPKPPSKTGVSPSPKPLQIHAAKSLHRLTIKPEPCAVCEHPEHRSRNGRIVKCRDCSAPAGMACRKPAQGRLV